MRFYRKKSIITEVEEMGKKNMGFTLALIVASLLVLVGILLMKDRLFSNSSTGTGIPRGSAVTGTGVNTLNTGGTGGMTAETGKSTEKDK